MSYPSRGVSMGLCPCLLMLFLLLALAECRPQFGFLDLFGAGELANGSSVLASLFQAHLQHTLEKFLALADVAQVFLNNTASG